MNNNIMIDIETLDTAPSAKIVSIGAVRFDIVTGELGSRAYQVVSLEDQHDRTISASTLQWWMKQSDAARSVFNDPNIATLRTVLNGLYDTFQITDRDLIWGNGATFDNVTLEHAYTQYGMTVPWKFWNNRDVRTLVGFGRDKGIDYRKLVTPLEGVAHNALDDAVYQAKYVSALYKELFLK